MKWSFVRGGRSSRHLRLKPLAILRMLKIVSYAAATGLLALLALWSAGFIGADATLDTTRQAPKASGGGEAQAEPKSRAKDGELEVDAASVAKNEKRPVKSRKSAGPKSTGSIGRTGTPPHGAAVFPDGTWLPPLNGVDIAPPFPGFDPKYPYAPVVKIVRGDKGVSWYIHADGSHSTTQMAMTEQGGRKFRQPAWVVGNPTDVLPVQVGSGADKKQFGPRR